MALEDLIFTLEGIQFLLIWFAPGFVTISCLRHWFDRLPHLDQIEIIFWSFPLSGLIIAFSYTIIAKMTNTPLTSFDSGLLATSGLASSIVIFISLLFLSVLTEESTVIFRIRYWWYYTRHVGFWKYIKRRSAWSKFKEKCPVCNRMVSSIRPYQIFPGEKLKYDDRIGRETEIIATDFMCRKCTRLKRTAEMHGYEVE